MILLKKLIFAPFFLTAFGLLIYQINPLLKSYDFILSLSINSFISLIILSAFISISSLIFVLFSGFSLDWKFIVPVGILASLFPVIFLNQALGLVFAAGVLVSLLFTYVSLENTMKSYLTFQPSTLFGPSIKHLSSLLILVICVTYFLSLNKIVQETGFEIPDSLIDTALKFTNQSQINQADNQLSLPPDQIELLKKNPQLLKQSGLDPNLTDNLIKQTVKDQVQSFLKPYSGFIPATVAILLFFTLQAMTSLISILIYPLLWVTFLILEKTGFIKFTTETREVKKMVI